METEATLYQCVAVPNLKDSPTTNIVIFYRAVVFG